jgi:hypothetical protein
MTIFGCGFSRILLPSERSTEVRVASFFAKLFTLWISGIAALIFLGALTLAILHIISWTFLVYIYIGISVFTLVLATLVYLSRAG